MTHGDFPNYYRSNHIQGLEQATLPTAVAAVWGAFLYEGLFAPRTNQRRSEDILKRWKSGSVALINASYIYLDKIWSYSRERWPKNKSPTGVFEHEVISAFGELLGYHLILHNGQLPPEDEAYLVIQELVDTFFDKSPNRPLSHNPNLTQKRS